MVFCKWYFFKYNVLAGDSRAILIKKENDGYKAYQITDDYNCMETAEQVRLTQQKPNEKDLFKYKHKGGSCWIKGFLMPTRSLGDFYLKVFLFYYSIHYLN